MKLNLGCGKDIKGGWVNLDWVSNPGVDVVADLSACKLTPLPLLNDQFDEMLASHLVEHIPDTLSLMSELHRVAKPGCKLTIRVPYGSSDDAWEDPTHVRPYFVGSFAPFAQTYYWRADYGYRGDWQVKRIVLGVSKANCEAMKALTQAQVFSMINQARNVVREMVAELEAVKPIREPKRELQEEVAVKITAI